MMTLTAKNSSNQNEVNEMVYMAACAWANWQDTIESADKIRSVAYKNEFEATMRCLLIFVDDGPCTVKAAIIESANGLMADAA